MFGTVVAVISILVLVLPGFVVADLQRRRRASASADSDWELVLRALSYSLLLHLLVSPWTRSVVLKIEDGDWQDHLGAVVVYGTVVLAIVPAAVGLALNALLVSAERSGKPLRLWHYALGARDARQSWDYLFQRIHDGRWMVVKLRSGGVVAGRFGTGSWASQSPSADGHDLWLQEIWTVDDYGLPAAQLNPAQGMWVARDEVATLFVIDPSSD